MRLECIGSGSGCSHAFEVYPSEYDRIGEELVCPECRRAQTVGYDEYFDEEECEEYAYWYMEPIE